MTIKNPIEWSGAQLVSAAHVVRSAGQSLHHIQDTIHSPPPQIRHISFQDVRDALTQGFDDFMAYRTDVIFLGVTYAVLGLILARFAFGMDMLPLLFPLASGFAIIGPIAALGLYEMSRLREQGFEARWTNAFDVFHTPAIGGIAVLAVLLVAIFLFWLGAAWLIFQSTLGPALPVTIEGFVQSVFFTTAGQTMIVVGVAVGFIFALCAMMVSIVSFPLLLDRDVGLDTAVSTSVRAVLRNPVPMFGWGLVVAGGLVLGSIPFFLGLVVVIPVLGHATWHLYRKVIV